MRTMTVVLVGVTVLVLVSVGVALQNVWVPLASAVVVGLATLLALVSRQADVRRRQAAFVADFGGSLDAVKAVIDVEHVREVRDEQGELKAVREVRRTVPQLSLERSVEVVRSL